MDAKSLRNRQAVDSTFAFVKATPSRYAIYGEKLVFDCAVSADTAYTMIYFQSLALLSVGSPTNFLTSRYPNLLRTAVLAAAADFRKDDADYQRNVGRLTALIDDINSNNDLYLRGVDVDVEIR